MADLFFVFFLLLSSSTWQQPPQTVPLKRFEVIRVNPEDLERVLSPLRAIFAGPLPDDASPVANPDEAARRAGFTPRLPSSAKTPELLVIAPVHEEMRIRAADLTAALQQAKVSNVAIPPAWDGVTFELQQGRGVLADYGEFFIAQAPPLTLTAPAGFPLDQFLEVLFRAAGMTAMDARNLQQKFASSPAAFFPIPPRYEMDIHEVQLTTGKGLLLQNADKGGELALMWSSPDRSYFISGLMTETEVIALANSVR